MDREIEFCKIEKCKIKTEIGKVIIKRGTILPQAREEQVEIHLKNFLNRRIIRKSNNQWRNPIRFIENLDRNIRLVGNLMALNDIVKKTLTLYQQ